MSVRFYARFNLQNNYSMVQIQTYLEEFSRIQDTRVAMLRSKYQKEIQTLKNKTVVFIGDSITNDNLGYRVSACKAAELEEIDGSLSGGTSSMILEPCKALIKNNIPDMVSVMIGANDSVFIEKIGNNQVGIREYSNNVKEFISCALEVGAKVLLFEITPVIEERFAINFEKQKKLQNNVNILKYNNALREIANEFNVEFLPNRWLEGQEHLFEPDGIHLSDAGQQAFTEKWLTAAAKLFN